MKKSTTKDWHPADIVAALHKRGASLGKNCRGKRDWPRQRCRIPLRARGWKGEWLVPSRSTCIRQKSGPAVTSIPVTNVNPRKPLHPMTTTDNSGT